VSTKAQNPTASAIFRGKQFYSSVMSGQYEDGVIYEGGSSSMGGPSLWGILGRPLGSGARVRVTVEVLDEGRPPKTTNPWKKALKKRRTTA
jgi:cytochrome c2